MPAEDGMMPLRVTAVMAEPVTFTFGTVALDALLAGQVARREGRPEPVRGEPLGDPPVPPLRRDPLGFYLASWAIPGRLMWSDKAHIHRPPPAEWYMRLCTDKVRRVDMGSGADKAHRIPRHRQRFDSLVWYCIGDPVQIETLLRGVTRIGSCRRDGVGKRKEWLVEETKPWDGFPVLHDGLPLRSLPVDYPGLANGFNSGMASLRFPYWESSYQEMLAIP